MIVGFLFAAADDGSVVFFFLVEIIETDRVNVSCASHEQILISGYLTYIFRREQSVFNAFFSRLVPGN